jgi:chromosome segregation ATPase
MLNIPEVIKNVARKVTLELVYEVIDERTRELKAEIGAVRTELKAEMESSRAELKAEIGAVRTDLKGELSDFGGEIGGLKGEIKELRQTMDHHYSQINGRIDQLYHLYAEFLRSQHRAG